MVDGKVNSPDASKTLEKVILGLKEYQKNDQIITFGGVAEQRGSRFGTSYEFYSAPAFYSNTVYELNEHMQGMFTDMPRSVNLAALYPDGMMLIGNLSFSPDQETRTTLIRRPKYNGELLAEMGLPEFKSYEREVEDLSGQIRIRLYPHTSLAQEALRVHRRVGTRFGEEIVGDLLNGWINPRQLQAIEDGLSPFNLPLRPSLPQRILNRLSTITGG